MSLISILMPARNVAPYLADCLQSILEQTISNWELIVVDDFSTDTTADILQQFAAQDNRITVLSNKERGIIPALRLAFTHSQGKYITRMDADDLMVDAKLEKMAACLTQFGEGHLCTALVSYFSMGQLGAGYQKYANWLNELSLREANFEDRYRECVIPSPCWMCHRTDLIYCGAFDADIYPEDYDLCFRFYKNNLKIKTVPETLHHWRDYATRTSRTDEHYADHSFLNLKIHYFLNLDYDQDRPLVLWGAGKKGKRLARQLYQQSIPFHWITNNQRKVGLYMNEVEVRMETEEIIKSLKTPQIIIAVAAPRDQAEIQTILDTHAFQKDFHFFYFC